MTNAIANTVKCDRQILELRSLTPEKFVIFWCYILTCGRWDLNVLGQGRGELNIDPPATKIVVTSQSGDTKIRCGDEQNIYTCSPGRKLELEYEVATPVVSFWGENLSDVQVRLQIDVDQIVPE